MLVGSVKNASLFQKFTLNLIGFGVCDLGEPIRCHSSLLLQLCPPPLLQFVDDAHGIRWPYENRLIFDRQCQDFHFVIAK